MSADVLKRRLCSHWAPEEVNNAQATRDHRSVVVPMVVHCIRCSAKHECVPTRLKSAGTESDRVPRYILPEPRLSSQGVPGQIRCLAVKAIFFATVECAHDSASVHRHITTSFA